MDDIELGKALTGLVADKLTPNSGAVSKLPANNTTTIYGEAQTDSENGIVTVQVDGTNIVVETTFLIKRGDMCIISITGHTPIVTGVTGRGDEQGEEIIEAGKTATDYITEDEDGNVQFNKADAETFTVGDTTKGNVHIDADSVDIRKALTVLASFFANQDTTYLKGSQELRLYAGEQGNAQPVYMTMPPYIDPETGEVTMSDYGFGFVPTGDSLIAKLFAVVGELEIWANGSKVDYPVETVKATGYNKWSYVKYKSGRVKLFCRAHWSPSWSTASTGLSGWHYTRIPLPAIPFALNTAISVPNVSVGATGSSSTKQTLPGWTGFDSATSVEAYIICVNADGTGDAYVSIDGWLM